MAIGTIFGISLDCADHEELAAFWKELLDGTVTYRDDKYILVKSAGGNVGAYRIQDYVPPTWPSGEIPKQIHLEIAVDDLDVAEREVMAIGAVKTEMQSQTHRWRIMLDPAGHPFCLYKLEPHLEIDEHDHENGPA